MVEVAWKRPLIGAARSPFERPQPPIVYDVANQATLHGETTTNVTPEAGGAVTFIEQAGAGAINTLSQDFSAYVSAGPGRFVPPLLTMRHQDILRTGVSGLPIEDPQAAATPQAPTYPQQITRYPI